MPAFGARSLAKLAELHPDLQKVLTEAIKYRDFAIICGYRDETEQNEHFATGRSKVQYPNSKHNQRPSLAVDVAPWYAEAPHIRWNDVTGFASLGGFITGIAAAQGIAMRWGADWDGDGDHTDQTFMDWPHLELL